MKVPLKMDTFHVDNDQFLMFWYKGKSETIKSPVLPFLYPKQTPPRYVQHEKVQKQLLYDRDYNDDLYKVTFPTVHALRQCSGYDFFEPNIKLKDRVYLDRPDLLEQYAHKELVVLSFDIETDSHLTFPNSKENAIIAFGTQCNGEDIGIDMSESHDDDYDILANFIKTIEKIDPDVYAHYNGTYFDWPFIFERCDIHGFDKSAFCRDDRDLFVRQYVKPDGKIEQSISFGGRVNYDILHRSVMRTNMPALLGMAEQVQISFDECISSSPSYIPEILFSREFGKRGIVSDMTVAAAYPFMSENKQGALVGCFKPGLYRRPLNKWDVISRSLRMVISSA
jgi:DNA polymerase elongation subunit (family B)